MQNNWFGFKIPAYGFFPNFSDLLQSDLQTHKGKSFIHDTGDFLHDSIAQALERQVKEAE